MCITFEPLNGISRCGHSVKATEQYFSCGAVYYAVRGAFNIRVGGWNLK